MQNSFRLLALLLFALLLAGSTSAFCGDGIVEPPIEECDDGATKISNCLELQAINDNAVALARNYILVDNIDCTGFDAGDGDGFMPIGGQGNEFTGSFDGRGYKIMNLSINRPSTDNVGLFGYTGTGSEIKNVGLTGINMVGDVRSGSLVGINYGTITNCSSEGTVNFERHGGGLVGDNRGTIAGSFSEGSVNAPSRVGGLVGTNSGNISGSHSSADVSLGDPNEVGGLVGYNLSGGTISTSYATGNVAGRRFVAGLAGGNSSQISNSYATGNVTITGNFPAGGLVGYSPGTISNSSSTGSVSGPSSGRGGLVGQVIAPEDCVDSFWNPTDASPTDTSACGTQSTQAAMQDIALYTTPPSDWDFVNTWVIDATHDGYPYLQLETVGYCGDGTCSGETQYACAGDCGEPVSACSGNCQANCTCLPMQLQITSFELNPSTVSLESAASKTVKAIVKVRNFSPAAIDARVEIEVIDFAGATVAGPLDATKQVSDSIVQFDQADELTFDVLGTWEQGNYAVHAKVYDDAGTLHDQKIKVLTVGLVKTAVPGFSLLLLPLLLAVVLLVLKKR